MSIKTGSITIREFQVAMETYGAKSLGYSCSFVSRCFVPCFDVAGTEFQHSGTSYIVDRGKPIPPEIIKHAMTKFGEKWPGGKNFWHGEIHSVAVMLTVATMLDGKYSKKLVDELTNATYKKLLECEAIKSNVEFPFHGTHSPKIEKLCKLLAEYSNIVNPFGNNGLKLKEPVQYLNDVNVSLALKEGNEYSTRLALLANTSHTMFKDFDGGWFYDTFVLIQRNRKNGYISMRHYYLNGTDGRPVDEVVCLDYKVNEHTYLCQPGDIDLRISLKTGLSWETYKEKQAKPATDEQIEIMIAHLKISIKKIKNRITRNMVSM